MSCFFMCFTFLGLTTCTAVAVAKVDGAPKKKVDFSKIPDAVPKIETSKQKGPKSYVIKGKRYYVLNSAKGYDKVGKASWYGTGFHGKKTASGDTYNLYAMTAASPCLPLSTYLKVTNLDNGRTVVIKVTDRGPFKNERILDLSYAAAQKLGYANKGTARVRATAIDPTQWAQEQARNTQLASLDTKKSEQAS